MKTRACPLALEEHARAVLAAVNKLWREPGGSGQASEARLQHNHQPRILFTPRVLSRDVTQPRNVTKAGNAGPGNGVGNGINAGHHCPLAGQQTHASFEDIFIDRWDRIQDNAAERLVLGLDIKRDVPILDDMRRHLQLDAQVLLGGLRNWSGKRFQWMARC